MAEISDQNLNQMEICKEYSLGQYMILLLLEKLTQL